MVQERKGGASTGEKGMVGGNSAWSQGSNLLGEFGISLNPNFIQSNQNVRGRVCRVQWTLSGLVLIRGGAFEGGWPDWSVIPPARPAQYEGYITRFDTFSSATYYQYRLEQYCFALLGWIGLGAVASDRGRRYCVKGFGVRPLQQKPLCLSPIYICTHPELERYWGSNTLTGSPCLSWTYSAPFYQHTFVQLPHIL